MSEVNSAGLYMWTDSQGQTRPNRGSVEAENRHKEWLRYRAEALTTKKGIEYTEKNGFSKTNHEDIDWLTKNGKI
jgi:hypothetical protein